MGFEKGKSGNPGGRPKKVREVMELAQEESIDSLRALIELRDTCEDPRVRLAASMAILDRGLGKPVQPVESKVEVTVNDAREMTTAQLDARIAELEGANVEH